LPDEDTVTDHQPRFWRYFTLAYEDVFRVIPRMWPVVLTVVAAVIVVGFLGGLVGNLVGTRLGHGLLDLLVSAGAIWVIAPYLVAIYRAVATDEVATRPESLRNAPATQRFMAWSILLTFIAGVPDVLFTVFGPDVPTDQLTEQDVNVGAMLVILVLTIAAWIFIVRATTLLPLLALDPDRASLPRALAQSKGHFWFIVGALLITTGLLWLVGLLLVGLIAATFGPLAPLLLVPGVAALTGVTLVMAVAVSTRLYQRYSDR
jgi:hypothetical protein